MLPRSPARRPHATVHAARHTQPRAGRGRSTCHPPRLRPPRFQWLLTLPQSGLSPPHPTTLPRLRLVRSGVAIAGVTLGFRTQSLGVIPRTQERTEQTKIDKPWTHQRTGWRMNSIPNAEGCSRGRGCGRRSRRRAHEPWHARAQPHGRDGRERPGDVSLPAHQPPPAKRMTEQRVPGTRSRCWSTHHGHLRRRKRLQQALRRDLPGSGPHHARGGLPLASAGPAARRGRGR